MTDKPEPKFKAGDIVSLKSESQLMTIEVVLPYHKVHPAIGYICVWLSSDGHMVREEISEAALRKAL
jgi:hypothetical protein